MLFFTATTATKADPEPNPAAKADVFKLPISYLDPQEITLLKPEVLSDLEWADPISTHIFGNHGDPLGKLMVEPMSRYITTNKKYLLDTQKLLGKWAPAEATTINSHQLLRISQDIDKADFHEYYYFIETQPLRKFNYSSAVMEATSVMNGIVPVFNLVMTVIMFVVPFVLIATEGKTLDLTTYVEYMLRSGKTHMISMIFSQVDTVQGVFHWKNLFWFLCILAFVVYVVYINVFNTLRFFERLARLSQNLVLSKEFLYESVERIRKLEPQLENLPHYRGFLQDLRTRKQSIEALLSEWSNIKTEWSGYFNMGDYLRSYYLIYDNAEFKDTFHYCLKLRGWLANMDELARKIKQGIVSMARLKASAALPDRRPHHNSFVGLVHPCLVAGTATPNNVDLKTPIVITGPNASGKTTLLKSLMIAVIMTQQYGCGFYGPKTVFAQPYTYLHSYLNIPDTSERDSLFEAECRRCKTILDALAQSDPAQRHFCIFDELFSGTNPTDACKTACAFLEFLQDYPIDYAMTTHFVDICKNPANPARNYKTQVEISGKELRFKYGIEPGISEIQGAYYILKRMEFPAAILDIFETTTGPPQET
jgi:hypothetical protein